MKCEKCGCPFMRQSGFRTADAFSAWKDDDGTWYCGPASESVTFDCMNDDCRFSYTITKSRGKLVSDSRTVAQASST
jgi:hypothetical protein